MIGRYFSVASFRRYFISLKIRRSLGRRRVAASESFVMIFPAEKNLMATWFRFTFGDGLFLSNSLVSSFAVFEVSLRQLQLNRQ